MNENDETNDTVVDRREETQVTHQPGYSAAEQAVLDVMLLRNVSFRIVPGLPHLGERPGLSGDLTCNPLFVKIDFC